MAEAHKAVSGTWATRWTFILAATGSAVGLGNIWKFPYITGEYGGGAFVLVYLACIAVVGIPIMMSEVLIGRHARRNPIDAMGDLAVESGSTRAWSLVGWMGVLAGFFILSFYSVIAGWALNYTADIGMGLFNGVSAEQTGKMFGELTGDPRRLIFWHTLFMILTAIIIARGIHRGLEASVRIMMPALFILLLVMVGYSITSTDKFGEGVKFLFAFDFSKLTGEAVLAAMGHAFFTLSLGMGAIMTYGAYMPKQASIGGTVVTIAVLDTVVALVAGMAIFPIVFANGLEPSAGPGLLFVSLPQAFGSMGGGQIFGTIFFLLVSIAALSSAISLIEPAVAYIVQRHNVSRVTATISFSVIVWLLGLGTVFSFNEWAEAKLFGKTFFDLLDFLTANIMLPLGGLLISIFAGWILKRSIVLNELAMQNLVRFNTWRAAARVFSPLAVLVIFVVTLYKAIS
ncbi:sodium-dependent transporter [Spartinivicinus ruber]|uniref:sodium-dependent transporter n=1 Tax=Spartinivicinus ruber TaxID=2683272 RepID=UPI0013D07692|nr:sodium-dependent transporter [Spartinivicinus ruber]